MDLLVLASGNGSTFAAIADECEHATVKMVLTDNPAGGVIRKAFDRGIPSLTLPHINIEEALDYYAVDLIVLAGYMRILEPSTVHQHYSKMVNIHPSLLPKYKGLHTHRRVLEAGDRYHGSTVHMVTEDLDSGPIIEQERIEILPHETETLLEARIHELEHKMYPEIIDEIAKGLIILPKLPGMPVMRYSHSHDIFEPVKVIY